MAREGINISSLKSTCKLYISSPLSAYNTSMNRLKHYAIIGTILIIISGALLHSIYEYSGNNPLLGFFFPVNESTWEHMKLCFFPMLLYSCFMNRKLKDDYPCVTSSLLFGVLLGTFLIPIIFYTYSGILGQNYIFFDIVNKLNMEYMYQENLRYLILLHNYHH